MKGSFNMPEVHTLLTGLAFGESPRWHQDRPWFADWGTQEVIAVELDGKSEVIVRVPTARPETRLNFGGAGQGPFSIDWLPGGRLLLVSGRDRLLLRRGPGRGVVAHSRL